MMFTTEVNSEVFAAYAFYSGILALKMILMIALTARQRFAKKVFANPEDAKLKGSKVKFDDPDVERIRRAHLNDMENILPFFAIAFIYIFTNPAIGTALLVFRVFTAARIVHTIVYAVIPFPQPSRALAFGFGVAAQSFMIFKILCHFA